MTIYRVLELIMLFLAVYYFTFIFDWRNAIDNDDKVDWRFIIAGELCFIVGIVATVKKHYDIQCIALSGLLLLIALAAKWSKKKE